MQHNKDEERGNLHANKRANLLVAEQLYLLIADQSQLLIAEQSKLLIAEQSHLLVAEQSYLLFAEQSRLLIAEREQTNDRSSHDLAAFLRRLALEREKSFFTKRSRDEIADGETLLLANL